jgi:arylsulfatase A-like enzyme/Flp pilus assembly protein TadD
MDRHFRQSTLVRRLLTCAACGALASAVALLSACARPAPERRDLARNVLLITIDTLRADAIGAYGNRAVSTPWMDRLAAGGVRFAQAHASTVVTLPSHANILSGVYPFRHGVRENAGFRFPAEVETVASLLHARGYRTAAFVSAFPLDARFGLTRGFDVYDDRYPKGETNVAFRVPERRGSDTVAAALEWIGRGDAGAPPAPARPWFVWVHLYEPHFPYAPPEPYASRYRAAPYLGEVAAADAALAPLLQPILDGPAGRDTLVVLTSDHGESLGEHGEMTHGLFAYEATLRVPLILYQPRLFTPREIATPVRHIDIAPTILDAVGAPVPQTLDGRTLLPIASGAAAAQSATYFESLSASLNRGWAPLYGVSRDSLKYIDLPIPELYDLAADSAEAHDLAASRPADVRELQRLLAVLRANDRGAAPARERADTREQLRSLGYLSGTAAPKDRYTEADDPKRLIEVDKQIEEVVSRYQRGDLRGAIELGERVVQRRPDMPLSLVHLAFLTEAGLADEAVRRLAPYAAAPQPDIDVLIAYGVALASSGRSREALDAFTRARSLDPANGLPLVDAATAYLMNGDRERAAASFAEALSLDPTLARAHNGLGVIAAQRKDYPAALDHWRRAVELDPSDFRTLFNLGDLLITIGRPGEARPYWERYLATAPHTLEASDRAKVQRWLSKQP